MNIQLISISLYLRRLTPNKGTPQSSAVTDRRSLFAGTMRPLSGAAGESLGDQERAPRVLKQQQQRMGTTSRQRRSCCYTTHFFFEPRPAAPVHSALRRTGSQPTCRQFVPPHFDLKYAKRVPQPLGNVDGGLTRLRAPSVPRLFEAALAGMHYRADVPP